MSPRLSRPFISLKEIWRFQRQGLITIDQVDSLTQKSQVRFGLTFQVHYYHQKIYLFLIAILFINTGHNLLSPLLKQILLQRGFSEVDLLYFSSPIFYPLLEKIPHKCSVFRIADQEAGYEHFSKIDGYQRAALARNVDLVIYSAKSMENDIKQLQPKRSMFLSNGVQLDNFINKSPQLPIEYELIGHPIVVYIGAMREWFDSDLINQVSFALPNVNFVLIGPNEAVRDRLEKRNNLHLLGQKSYKDLPKFLYHADLGIIPFNRVKISFISQQHQSVKTLRICGLWFANCSDDLG